MRAVLGLILFLCMTAAAQSATVASPLADPSRSTLGQFWSLLTPYSRATDQSGLDQTYTSGVTDFDTFVSSATHSASVWTPWTLHRSSPGTTTGRVVYEFDQVQSLGKFALWHKGNDDRNVQQFRLLFGMAEDLSDLTVVLEASMALASSNSAQLAQVFEFATTEARYVALEVLSNFGDATYTEIPEILFGTVIAPPAEVPVPPALPLMGAALAGLVWLRRGRRCAPDT